MALPRYVMDTDTTEYRRILVTAFDEDGSIDPTPYEVDVAFVATGSRPTEDDWHEGSWVSSGSSNYVRILVGPEGGVELQEADYAVYVRINAGAEYPVMLTGYLALR